MRVCVCLSGMFDAICGCLGGTDAGVDVHSTNTAHTLHRHRTFELTQLPPLMPVMCRTRSINPRSCSARMYPRAQVYALVPPPENTMAAIQQVRATERECPREHKRQRRARLSGAPAPASSNVRVRSDTLSQGVCIRAALPPRTNSLHPPVPPSFQACV